jgi:hypothetical protein
VKDGFHYPSVAEVLRVTITPGPTATLKFGRDFTDNLRLRFKLVVFFDLKGVDQ